MNKYIIAILIVLFLVGCEGETAEKPQAGKSPYIGGTKGLVSEFGIMGVYNEDSGQEEIFENESFPIEIALKNKGEEDISAGAAKVALMGVNPVDFSNIPAMEKLNSGVIEKISEYNEEGGEETIDFTDGANDAVYTVPLAGSSYDVSVFAKVIYSYKTRAAVPKVCFKGDFSDKSICKVEETKKVYSSAAPIQVTSAEESKAGTGKVALKFTVENKGSGGVAKPGEDFDSRYDMLVFEVSNPDEWECKSGGRLNEARLDSNGKATIVCKLKEAVEVDQIFTGQVDLTLSYDYKEIVHKQVRIRKQ